MKKFTEEEIINYVKERHGYVNDSDLYIHFIPEESDVYFKLHNEIDLLVLKGKLLRTSGGYKLKEDI